MKRVLVFYLIVCLTVVGAAWVYEQTRPAQEAAAIGSSLPVVVLDAGHGGEDGGAVTATGVYESRLNLEITLRLNDFLQLLGVPTRMVRTGDVSVSTEGETVAQRKSSDIRNRVALVESIPGCWLVSVHQNRFEQEQYRGAQVFYRSSEESKRLAQTLQEQLCAQLDPKNNRRIKQASGIYLLEHVTCPAVLIECGFLSNPAEAQLLQQETYQRKLAAVIGCTIFQTIGAQYEG